MGTLPEVQWSVVPAELRQSPVSFEQDSQPSDSAGPTASGMSPALCPMLLGVVPYRQSLTHTHWQLLHCTNEGNKSALVNVVVIYACLWGWLLSKILLKPCRSLVKLPARSRNLSRALRPRMSFQTRSEIQLTAGLSSSWTGIPPDSR